MTDDTDPDFFRVNKPKKREPSPWQKLADDMMENEDRLTEWEYDFLNNYLERKHRVPTERMKDVFAKLCDEYGFDYPEDDDD